MTVRVNPNTGTRPLTTSGNTQGSPQFGRQGDHYAWAEAAQWFAQQGKRELTLLLFVSWDPIGINDASEAWREYESYTEQIARLVLQGASDADLVNELARIAREEIELDSEADEAFGAALRRWVSASLLGWRDERD